MIFMRIAKYLFPFQRPIARFPRRPALKDNLKEAGADELLLVRLGHARSTEHARRLIAKYDAKSAMDVIEALPVRKRSTWLDRLKRVGMKITGEELIALDKKPKPRHSIDVVAVFKDRNFRE